MSTFPYSVRYLGGMFIDVRQIIGEKNARVEATSASTDGRALDSNTSVRRVRSITNDECVSRSIHELELETIRVLGYSPLDKTVETC